MTEPDRSPSSPAPPRDSGSPWRPSWPPAAGRLVLDARHGDVLSTRDRGPPGRAAPGRRRRRGRPGHRRDLVDVAAELGGARLLVNNASTLGASPLPALADLDPATYLRLLEVNLVAPLALTAALLPQLRRHGGVVLNVTSDASVEAYETWGGYGSSKAALDHASRVLAAEEPAPAGVRRRPRRHAHPDAPGRVPRRGHLRPAGAGAPWCRRCSGSSRATCPAAATAPPSCSASPALERVRMSAVASAHGHARRPAGWPATRSGWRSSPPVAPSTPSARDLPRWLEPGDLLVVNTSATLPVGAWTTAARRRARLDRARRRRLGGRAAPARRPRPRTPEPGEVLRLPGGVRLRIDRPHPDGQDRLWRATTLPIVRPGRLPAPARPADPLPLPATASWPIEDLQNVYATVPGQRRDAQRRPPAVPRGARRPDGGRGRRGPAGAAHRGGQPGVARAAAAGVALGARPTRPGWSS